MNDEKSKYEVLTSILNLQEHVYMFVKAVTIMYRDRSEQVGKMAFNKDDDLSVDFVCAASNLRAFNFSIPNQVTNLIL